MDSSFSKEQQLPSTPNGEGRTDGQKRQDGRFLLRIRRNIPKMNVIENWIDCFWKTTGSSTGCSVYDAKSRPSPYREGD